MPMETNGRNWLTRISAEWLSAWQEGWDRDVYEWTHPMLAKYLIAAGIVVADRARGRQDVAGEGQRTEEHQAVAAQGVQDLAADALAAARLLGAGDRRDRAVGGGPRLPLRA